MTVASSLQGVISENIASITKTLQACSTESVVGYCLVENMRGFPDSVLSSPAKQIRFLLGILIGSEEPASPREFAQEDWVQIFEPLERVFHAYMELYLPSDGSIATQSKQWHKIRQVAMMTFLNYHNNALLASSEQISDRIKTYMSPFDDKLSDALGISASEALEIALWIGSRLQERLDDVSRLRSTKHGRVLNQLKTSRTDLNDLLARDGELAEFSVELAHALSWLGKISHRQLTEQYGECGEVFWEIFTVGRGGGPPPEYPTERSVVESKPLIQISDDVAMLFDFNALLAAILSQVGESLDNGPSRAKFFRSRDKILEEQTTLALRRILRGKTEVHRNLFESPDLQREHDLVILTNEICLFVETKATPPAEPFRDPEKAFTSASAKLPLGHGHPKGL